MSLDEVKEESVKAGLKLNIQRTKIMAYGPITSWQIEGEKVQVMTDFIFLSSKITVDCDCSHEIKRKAIGKKAMTNLKHRQHIKKQRYHFSNKHLYSQSYGFSCSYVQM